jgi:hypothetical protein
MAEDKVVCSADGRAERDEPEYHTHLGIQALRALLR